MDSIRRDLNVLMGEDRDLPLKEKKKQRKHFDDRQVCQFYLLDFCPHDLFPHTKNDLGPCKKRHDIFFKQQFENDPNREQYQIRYEEQLLSFLQGMIEAVDAKMKKGLERIEAPLPETEKPKDVLDRIKLCDLKIQELIPEAERLGELGLIDESDSVMKQIDKLREQKNELNAMSEHPLIAKEKQMKICEVCGALQSIQDNDKRLQTHFEGKLHTGYAKIRQFVEQLKTNKINRRLREEEWKEKERIQRQLLEQRQFDSSFDRGRDFKAYREKEERDFKGPNKPRRGWDNKERQSNPHRRRHDRSRSRSIEEKLQDLSRREKMTSYEMQRERPKKEDRHAKEFSHHERRRNEDKHRERRDSRERHRRDKRESRSFERKGREWKSGGKFR